MLPDAVHRVQQLALSLVLTLYLSIVAAGPAMARTTTTGGTDDPGGPAVLVLLVLLAVALLGGAVILVIQLGERQQPTPEGRG